MIYCVPLEPHVYISVHNTGAVVGGWGGKDKPYFDYVSLIDSDSLQVSCHFPDLVKCCRVKSSEIRIKTLVFPYYIIESKTSWGLL